MVTKIIYCYHCGENLVKNGRDPKDKQRYHCKGCNRASLENPDYGYSEAFKENIVKAYQEHSSPRGVARTFGKSRGRLVSSSKLPFSNS